jgi:hypothetical protein
MRTAVTLSSVGAHNGAIRRYCQVKYYFRLVVPRGNK